MKILTNTTMLCGLISLLGSGTVFAQDPPPPAFSAIDSYICNYNEGKNRADLDKVIAKWNKWMDKQGGAAYSAWVMTPVLGASNYPMDFAWLGVWANGNDMGKGMQSWMEDGGAMSAEFDSVMTCPDHSNAASVNVRPPGEGWPTKSGVTVFTDCAVAEGKTMQDAMAANRAWAAHLDSTGSKAGMWAFFPGAGSSDPGYDYKMVSSYPDFEAYGADWESYTNGQGWAKAGQIFGGVTDCGSQRVYHSSTVRDGGVSPVPK